MDSCMNRLFGEIPADTREGCVAIGNFDGVHRGHAQMCAALLHQADRVGTHAVVVTFDPHPISLLRPEFTPPLLTTVAERRRLLSLSGIEHLVVLRVTTDLLQLSADEFFQQFIVEHLQAKGVVEGPNFRFGRDRGGDVNDLKRMCAAVGIPLDAIELVADHQVEISSSRIRRLIEVGELAVAVDMLGHFYRVTGTVSAGAGRGARLGFPTANLTGVQSLVPGHGVYAGMAAVDGRSYVAAVSIGPNPTFADMANKVECFLDGFHGDLYGKTLSVDLISEVRRLQKFSGTDTLLAQIEQDVVWCRSLVGPLLRPAD